MEKTEIEKFFDQKEKILEEISKGADINIFVIKDDEKKNTLTTEWYHTEKVVFSSVIGGIEIIKHILLTDYEKQMKEE